MKNQRSDFYPVSRCIEEGACGLLGFDRKERPQVCPSALRLPSPPYGCGDLGEAVSLDGKVGSTRTVHSILSCHLNRPFDSIKLRSFSFTFLFNHMNGRDVGGILMDGHDGSFMTMMR